MTTETLQRAIYGANVSDEERAEALMTDAYARCVKLLALAEALRYPAGRFRPDGKQYLPRATMNDAIRIMQLAEVNRDV